MLPSLGKLNRVHIHLDLHAAEATFGKNLLKITGKQCGKILSSFDQDLDPPPEGRGAIDRAIRASRAKFFGQRRARISGALSVTASDQEPGQATLGRIREFSPKSEFLLVENGAVPLEDGLKRGMLRIVTLEQQTTPARPNLLSQSPESLEGPL